VRHKGKMQANKEVRKERRKDREHLRKGSKEE
jgi:hypothetical protein